MDIKRINPWNWLRPEEDAQTRNLPVERTSSPGYGDLSQLHRDIDSFFDNVFRSFGMPAFGTTEPRFLKPNVDVASGDKDYTISVEVPGVDEKDIRLELTGEGLLTIRGEKRCEDAHEDRNYHRIERSYGAFQRTLALPEDANRDAIEASFKNGVLKITVPRMAQAKSPPKLIEIHTAA